MKLFLYDTTCQTAPSDTELKALSPQLDLTGLCALAIPVLTVHERHTVTC